MESTSPSLAQFREWFAQFEGGGGADFGFKLHHAALNQAFFPFGNAAWETSHAAVLAGQPSKQLDELEDPGELKGVWGDWTNGEPLKQQPSPEAPEGATNKVKKLWKEWMAKYQSMQRQ